MKNRLITLLLAAAVSFDVTLSAQTSPPRTPPDSGDASGASQSATSTTLRLRGTIENYDVASHTLSVSTSSGIVQLPVTSTTRIRQGGHRVAAADLQSLAGNRATIRYTESGGNTIVESVHVFLK